MATSGHVHGQPSVSIIPPGALDSHTGAKGVTQRQTEKRWLRPSNLLSDKEIKNEHIISSYAGTDKRKRQEEQRWGRD